MKLTYAFLLVMLTAFAWPRLRPPSLKLKASIPTPTRCISISTRIRNSLRMKPKPRRSWRAGCATSATRSPNTWAARESWPVLKNGAGPTVMLRTELDALPVEEKTGLPYASKVHTKDDSGRDVGVMHACGHDVHMASLFGTAAIMAHSKRHLARNSHPDWPARRGNHLRRQADDRRRPDDPLSQARRRPGPTRGQRDFRPGRLASVPATGFQMPIRFASRSTARADTAPCPTARLIQS